MDFNILDLLSNFVNQVYNFIMPLIDWMVFALVLASGYFVRATKLLPKWSKTIKILVFSIIVTLSYSIANDVESGVFIASYFMAFGFHSAILKLLERAISKIVKKEDPGIVSENRREKGIEGQNIVGDRPDDR